MNVDFTPSLPPAAGVLLLAAANLLDPNFTRSVVLLCQHGPEGSYGLVLNRPLEHGLVEVLDDLRGWDAPLYAGGPVQRNTLHFLHARADLDIGSHEVLPGVYWGGDFEGLRAALEQHRLRPDECRFFLGYSGWGEGQLEGELKQQSWYLAQGHAENVFVADPRQQWRQILRTLGGSYTLVSTFPDDPRLN